MKTLHIPTLGTVVTLAAPWTFRVYNERRNTTLLKWLNQYVGEDKGGEYFPLGVKNGDGYDPHASERSIPCTLPKGTKLTIDRIYIRKGLDDFNSVTFFLKGAKTKRASGVQKGTYTVAKGPNTAEQVPYEFPWTSPSRPVRFWAKLADVNTMKITG